MEPLYSSVPRPPVGPLKAADIPIAISSALHCPETKKSEQNKK